MTTQADLRQAATLQAVVWFISGGHGVPSVFGCCVIVRSRIAEPPPQLTEHGAHGDQGLVKQLIAVHKQDQSTHQSPAGIHRHSAIGVERQSRNHQFTTIIITVTHNNPQHK
jgi:hypothetical protein